jgi:hypothetical protein
MALAGKLESYDMQPNINPTRIKIIKSRGLPLEGYKPHHQMVSTWNKPFGGKLYFLEIFLQSPTILLSYTTRFH